MQIERMPVDQIRASAYNPRKDLKPGDPEYEKLKKSIIEFDMVEPLVWNKKTGNLVGGHQRLKILKELGVEGVEVSVVDLSEVKEKALNLALNKISGEWDMPRLKDLLEELDTGEFDIEITGFDFKEVESLMAQFHPTDEDLPTPLEMLELAGLDARSKYLLLIYGNEEERAIWLRRLGLENLPSDRRLIALEDIEG